MQEVLDFGCLISVGLFVRRHASLVAHSFHTTFITRMHAIAVGMVVVLGLSVVECSQLSRNQSRFELWRNADLIGHLSGWLTDLPLSCLSKTELFVANATQLILCRRDALLSERKGEIEAAIHHCNLISHIHCFSLPAAIDELLPQYLRGFEGQITLLLWCAVSETDLTHRALLVAVLNVKNLLKRYRMDFGRTLFPIHIHGTFNLTRAQIAVFDEFISLHDRIQQLTSLMLNLAKYMSHGSYMRFLYTGTAAHLQLMMETIGCNMSYPGLIEMTQPTTGVFELMIPDNCKGFWSSSRSRLLEQQGLLNASHCDQRTRTELLYIIQNALVLLDNIQRFCVEQGHLDFDRKLRKPVIASW